VGSVLETLLIAVITTVDLLGKLIQEIIRAMTAKTA
jgi:hypothetical protein